eukprot:GFUD01096697.1.p1 GENE.GFUD01096697.1~~GFUD01096697.1.p1  ORF type:complete len:666 (+),score=130.36 GFUD01096697.1:170-2167(+)
MDKNKENQDIYYTNLEDIRVSVDDGGGGKTPSEVVRMPAPELQVTSENIARTPEAKETPDTDYDTLEDVRISVDSVHYSAVGGGRQTPSEVRRMASPEAQETPENIAPSPQTNVKKIAAMAGVLGLLIGTVASGITVYLFMQAGPKTEPMEKTSTKTSGTDVDCEWGNYGDWSLCSNPLGLGNRTKTRSVKRVATGEGVPCNPEDAEISLPCIGQDGFSYGFNISSSGGVRDDWPDYLGVFLLQAGEIYDEYPTYKHDIQNVYLYHRSVGKWVVSTTLNPSASFFYSTTDGTFPPAGDWKYNSKNGPWKIDTTFTVQKLDDIWTGSDNLNCYTDKTDGTYHGARNILPDPWMLAQGNWEACKEACMENCDCTGFIWGKNTKSCHLRKFINLSQCKKSSGGTLYQSMLVGPNTEATEEISTEGDCEWDNYGDWSLCSNPFTPGIRTKTRPVKRVATGQGVPCNPKDADISQPCIGLNGFPYAFNISSSGGVRDDRSEYLGVFLLQAGQIYDEYPTYKHDIQRGYLYRKSSGNWCFSGTPNPSTSAIYSPTDGILPPAGDWKYTKDGNWTIDTTLTVQKLDDNWTGSDNLNCYTDKADGTYHGARNILPDPWMPEQGNWEACKEACMQNCECTGFIWGKNTKNCHLRKTINPSQCQTFSDSSLYYQY